MAIAAIPQNTIISQGNGQILIQWDMVAGATSYDVQRSLDNVTYTFLATSTVPNYVDTTVSLGVQYWYKVASVNGSGTSPYTTPVSAIPAPSGELSLGELRERAQQRADRLNSNFITIPEWNFFIDQAMYELYDLLITSYEDYFIAPPISFNVVANQFMYALPNGSNTFYDVNNTLVTPPALYKLAGVDLAISNAQNAFVTVSKYNFIDRNNYIYPNSNSTIYGVFNLQYRLMGSNIQFIPTPANGQTIRLWYIPKLPQLLKDTDLTTIGFSGWLQYVIIRAAKYALDKEESDTSKLDQELAFLTKRIEESAMNRDAGRPDTISDVRRGTNFGGNGPFNGFRGGWIFAGLTFGSLILELLNHTTRTLL